MTAMTSTTIADATKRSPFQELRRESTNQSLVKKDPMATYLRQAPGTPAGARSLAHVGKPTEDGTPIFTSAAQKQQYERLHKSVVIDTNDQSTLFFKDAKMFLHMMTEQLKNQNPNKPFDVNQFTQQMAMFSQVEQTLDMNKQLKNMVSHLQFMQNVQGASLIGKEIEIDTSFEEVSTPGQALQFAYRLPKSAGLLKIKIYDPGGQPVHEEVLFNGGLQDQTVPAGNYTFAWNAVDSNGKPLPKKGKYTFEIEAKNLLNGLNPDGSRQEEHVFIEKSITSKIHAYITGDDRQDPMVVTESGKNLPLNQIKRIIASRGDNDAVAEADGAPQKKLDLQTRMALQDMLSQLIPGKEGEKPVIANTNMPENSNINIATNDDALMQQQ